MSTSTIKTGLEDTQDFLERAFSLWRKAQVVHESPSWQGQPEARAIAEEIAASHPECEASLAGALHHENALVVAYALIALELMNSDILQNLPEELLQRPSNLTLLNGSAKCGMDLGGLARQVQKRASQRRAAKGPLIRSEN